MASSSQAATCNSGDVSSAVSSIVSKDEEAMWNRLLEVETDLEWNRLFQRGAGEKTQPTEEIVIKAATSSKGPSVSFQYQDSSASFKSVDFELSNNLLKWLEGQQATPKFSSPRMCFFLSKLLVSDRQRKGESSFLKLFWRYSIGIADDDLLLFLSKLAQHYLPSHEVENLEEFMLTNEERTKFLNDCSTFDKATRLAKDFNKFSLAQVQKPLYWTRRDQTLHSVNFSESVKPLELIFPFSTRFETAKKCLARLDLLKSVTADLNPDESDTLASVLRALKSPELQALHALKKEMELPNELALQLDQLSGKHLHAYKGQLKRPDEFFRTCQEEKRNVFLEALYKKVKCLASIEKASVNRQVKLSSEDILKGIVQKAGSAFKEVEGKLKKTQSSENVDNKECTLCSLEFSKKRKRACLDPCGHASACIDCATKAWTKKPGCPWCKVCIQKPISIPAQIFL